MSTFGLLNVNKPSGVTSRRVVDQIKRLVKPAKVGHAGTLDPLASGVLVIGIGQATRLVEYVQAMPKTYRATFLLGRTSTTEDVEGAVTLLENPPVPTREELAGAAARLTGEIQQRPPAYSALKVDGRRAYARARAGETVELAERPVQIHRIVIVGYDYPELQLEIDCGSGTYVRSLGRDLAERVGAGAVMSALVRTAIGRFRLEDAIVVEQLTRDDLAQQLLPATLAVTDLMPTVEVCLSDVVRLGNGLPIELDGRTVDVCAAVDAAGQLIAILGRRPDGQYAPTKYFPTAADGPSR
ncbi:MAG: tRNA pseudouridine(55) synthase TruB [Pirellulales bacterium]